MNTTTEQTTRSIDVTGLPEEAIRAVQSVVSLLRTPQAGSGPGFASRDAWVQAIRRWAESHPKQATDADWSRESIYDSIGSRYFGSDPAGSRRTRKWIQNTSQINTLEYASQDQILTRSLSIFCPRAPTATPPVPTPPPALSEIAASSKLKHAAAASAWLTLPPLREIVEAHGRDKQRNGEVNQHHMLRVFG